MTFRSAHRPPRRTGPRRIRRRRVVLAATVLAAAPIAVPHGGSAIAHVAQEHEIASGVAIDLDEAGQQSFTVPASVELPTLSRDAEVTAVEPPAPAWALPASGALRDGFGPRPDAPVAGVSGYHRGQDVGAACGTAVRAVAGGRVIEAGWSGTYGNWILLRHAGGVETGYAHAQRLLVRAGQRVAAGDVIADAGSTGASSGCHLHLEVRVHGHAVDPVAFLQPHGVRLGSR